MVLEFLQEVFSKANNTQLMNLKHHELKIYNKSKNDDINSVQDYIKMLRQKKKEFEYR